MATQASAPLLDLRPGLLGAGGRLGNINIFLEMSRLSSIAQYCSNMAKLNLKNINELDDIDRSISSESEVILLDHVTEEQPEHVPEEQRDHVYEEQPDQVIEETHDHMIEERPNHVLQQKRDHVTTEQSTSTSKAGDDLSIHENESPTRHSKSVRTAKCAELVDYPFNEKSLKLFETLKKFGIDYRTEIYREKNCRLEVDPMIFYCKNLFLKDRKGQLYLCICHEDAAVDLKQLRKELKAYRNFSFGTAEDLETVLDVVPGGVTPLALMNGNARNVQMVISNSLVREGASLMFHPMDSNLATNISLSGLLRFLKHFNHAVTFVS